MNNLPFKINPINNYFYNEFNPMLLEISEDEINDFTNNNNKSPSEIYLNNVQNEKPIDLFFISTENQIPFINNNDFFSLIYLQLFLDD